jgi:hypothetical protein
MVKFTYIVPTLLKFDRFYEQIYQISKLDCIKEIVIINNSEGKEVEKISEKIKEIKTNSSELYCNGSWNIGVEHAESEWIILATDDVIFNINVIRSISEQIGKIGNLGIIGCNYDVLGELKPFENVAITRAGTQREYCYGLLMFLKKINYSPIPFGIRHHYGDDYLYYIMLEKGLANAVIVSNEFKIETEIGSMSGSEETKKRINLDREYWLENYYEKYYKYGQRCG